MSASSARRDFLRFLAASPLAAQLFAQDITVNSPKDAINVLDFEPLAKKALPPAHWGYLSTGVDDDATLHANRDAFTHFQIRARRLVDVSKVDLSTTVFGAKWDLPFYVSAVGAQKAFNVEGELATARAAKAQKAMQMLSTVSSFSVEDVAKQLGTAPWYQLYMPTNWPDTEKMVKRAEDAGCPVLAWTVDLLAGRKLWAFGLTEPGAGSDSQSMKTRAEKKPGGWVLNGRKHWISGAHVADVVMIMAVNDPARRARGGITAFLVEKGTPGFNITRVDTTIGSEAIKLAEITIEDCFVPDEAVLGEVGQGFRIAMESLTNGRMGVACSCLGTADRLIELSAAYAKERVTFGQPLAERQAIQWMLAEIGRAHV